MDGVANAATFATGVHKENLAPTKRGRLPKKTAGIILRGTGSAG